MIGWKKIIVALVITLVLIFVARLFLEYGMIDAGILLILTSPLVGGFILGFTINQGYKKSVVKGAATGVIVILIFLFSRVVEISVLNLASSVNGLGVYWFVSFNGVTEPTIMEIVENISILLIVFVILTIIGALLGAWIKRILRRKKIKNQSLSEEKFHSPNGTLPFTMENIQKCLCTSCPVQENSNCIQEKNMILDDKISQGDLMLDADETPALYCLTGETDCSDIDTAKNCICTECSIYQEYQLNKCQTSEKYCLKGEAE